MPLDVFIIDIPCPILLEDSDALLDDFAGVFAELIGLDLLVVL